MASVYYQLFTATMFDTKYRSCVYDYVIRLSTGDERIIAGAVVGSFAREEQDRWSDIDLTFAVVDHVFVLDVLEDWTRKILSEFDGAHLFDVCKGKSIYRVFILPGCLQLDLSFTPASMFGAMSKDFKLIFGSYKNKMKSNTPTANDLFGYAVHHAMRARFSIVRKRYWSAEYWISATRDCVLSLACLHHGLPVNHSKGFDTLPEGVSRAFMGTLVLELSEIELDRALRCAIEGLLKVGHDAAPRLTSAVEPQLLELMDPL